MTPRGLSSSSPRKMVFLPHFFRSGGEGANQAGERIGAVR